MVQRFGYQLEVSSVIDQASAAQQQIVVIAGETFKKPQQLGVVFLVIVIRHQFCRPQALDVPSMKILVADQPQ
ncbi:hypothetical protein D3C72_2024420 [compost metagenome]